MASSPIETDLRHLLGDEDAFRFFENFAGCRVYIPWKWEVLHADLSEVLTEGAIKKLSADYGGTYIACPMARDFRALQYLGLKMSYRQIALRLGMTENGVYKIKARLEDLGYKF
ncbi:hypothetical protein SAMN05421890_1279 [Ensifer adhaerens]|nr:hypothetical protein SAMN05421890_1279 [Ensifer adhaerens]